ncbi:MAG: aminotransferase class I/II-fold pyridoxal phosphate-dependent enzyme [Erysipelotrichaceae bacterium]|nr:aminotransferase class I/II-fold pyridoxal phosphate-dependent enzyme [Erysipelotrichaceae bacterium]
MTKFDFTSIMDRRHHDAIAVDCPAEQKFGFTGFTPKEGFDIIPMWVADMNFPVVPAIQKAMQERIDHPAFGYFMPRDEYFESIIRWQKEHHGIEDLKPEHIGYENGVLGGVVSAMNVLAGKGGKILLHSPTYIGFTGSLENNGFHLVLSPLYQDDSGIWRMDYEDMEKRIVEEDIHAAIMCNPHNPTGRVWEKEELEKAYEIFERHDVYVVSDEIWSDLTLDGYRHIPCQSVSEYARSHTAAMYAPSKTFNLAGLIGSYHIIYDKWLCDRILKESSLSHYNSMNILSMYALIGAYSEEGKEWVEELRQVLSGNVDWAYSYIREHFEGVSLLKPQGTYMLFIDCEEFCKKQGIDIDELLRKGWEVGVFWQDGRPFHGRWNIRMNLALPLSRVQEAFERLDRYVFNGE